tara:strand:- start:958 stop:1674 length:717 start_codon:yes stop_codon:yes gene_type:complete
MNNIICTHLGSKYGDEYVKILYNMVERNTKLPFKFYCLSDRESYGTDYKDKINILRRPTAPKGELALRAWWAKLYYFHPELGIKGLTLSLDLDILIQKNIDEIFTYIKPNEFGCVRDFGQPEILINSSVMLFYPENQTSIWTEYMLNRPTWIHAHGDQNIITDLKYNDSKTKFMPDEWTYSFKWPERGKIVKFQKYRPNLYPRKEGPIFCVFHGFPNPSDAKKLQNQPEFKWIEKVWY